MQMWMKYTPDTSQRPGEEISKVIICGEVLDEGLDSYIADELKIITETLSSLKEVKGTETLSPSSIVAAGAALGGIGTNLTLV